jgi:hypothetical protein
MGVNRSEEDKLAPQVDMHVSKAKANLLAKSLVPGKVNRSKRGAEFKASQQNLCHTVAFSLGQREACQAPHRNEDKIPKSKKAMALQSGPLTA